MYVDQLEDRLANYALARKEAEASKFECESLALKAKKSATEVDEYKCRVEALERERDEKTKPLLGLGDLIAKKGRNPKVKSRKR